MTKAVPASSNSIAGIAATGGVSPSATAAITALLAIAGLAFSAWLTYVEIWELEAICIWCVGSAICMALLAALSTTRLLRAPAH